MVLGVKEKEKLQGLLKGAIVQTCLENLSFRCEVDGLVCVTVTMPGGSVDQVVVKMHEVLNGVSAHSYSSTQPSPYSKEPQSGLKTYLSSHKELHANIHNLKYTNDTGGGIHSNHHHNRAHSRNFSPSVQTTRTTSNNAYHHQQHGRAGEEADAPFICSLCLSNCTTYQELEKHFQDYHSSNITHFCSSCNIGFESEADCSSHRQSAHPQNCSPEASDFVVSGGGDSNSGRSSAPTSRRKQSKPRKGVAEENLESTATDHGAIQEWNSLEESDDGSEMMALRIDMTKDALSENNNNDLTQRNHNEPGSLEIKDVGSLLDNSSSPRELMQYCCPQCREPFGSFSTLEQHCYADHRLYVCSTCLQTFPQKVNRDRHVYIKHAGSKPFSCDICGASFTRRDTLKKHKCKGGLNPSSFSPSSSRNSPLVTYKSENDAIKMEVDVSEYGLDLSHSSKNRSTGLDNVDSKGSFYVENDYFDSGTPQGRSNQNSEDDEDQGGDGLPLALSLSIKDSTVSPYTALNKKYNCDRCSLVVMGSSAYIDHCKVIHRRTPCLHCGKTFSQKGNMERHKRQHTGERPFQCSECPSSYTRRETLKSHMSQAHGMQLQQQQPLRIQQSLQVEQLQQQLLLAVAASGGSSLNDTFPEEDDSPLMENLPEE